MNAETAAGRSAIRFAATPGIIVLTISGSLSYPTRRSLGFGGSRCASPYRVAYSSALQTVYLRPPGIVTAAAKMSSSPSYAGDNPAVSEWIPGSEYLLNLFTHGIVTLEAVLALGLWFAASRPSVTRAGLVAWPAIGLLAGETFWVRALAIFCMAAARFGRI